MSWLSFNERVLELAEDKKIPLLERVRFLSIFSTNLDEFFMIRVAGLRRRINAGIATITRTGKTPNKELADMLTNSKILMNRAGECFKDSILPELNEHKIYFVKHNELSDENKQYFKKFFNKKIYTILTPLAVDPSHPFQYISGL